MKLKNGIITDSSSGEFIAVATGEASRIFNGMIKNNVTANFLFEKLMSDTTEEKLVCDLLAKYDVSEETAKKDVHNFLEKIRKTGLLDE
ncbi:MAG: PqqD family protein [Ruminococcus sp.]|nr:PqqD family protein [Ruminococcus sp.]